MANKKNNSPMQVGFWLIRINPKTGKLYTKEEAQYHIKTFRKSNIEYWLERGYSYEEAVKCRSNFQKESFAPGKKTRKEHPELVNTHIEYWLAKGYSYEEAEEKLSERQRTFSLETCIKKYGIKKGTKIFQERQKKWQATLTSKPLKEQKQINKQKTIFYKFTRKNAIRDEKFFDELEKVCKRNNLKFIRDIEEVKKYICNMFMTTSYIEGKGINFFITKCCPSYLYKVLGISKKTVINWLKELDIVGIYGKPYLISTGKIKQYHLVANTGDILVSKLEIAFYYKLLDAGISIQQINKCYPNSRLKFDFKVNNIFIEIGGLLDDKDYKCKILYKRNTFGAFILTDNVKEYDDFITRVLIKKDKDAIRYYSSRDL